MSILQKQLDNELDLIVDPSSDRGQRHNRDLRGFQENIGTLIDQAKRDENFGFFDFVSNTETHMVDIGRIEPDLELDIFDAIRVSKQIPFVALNIDATKIEDERGLVISKDRRFKIYHSSDIETPHQRFIDDWVKSTNISKTIVIKVLISDINIERTSYINVMYRFDQGLFIEFAKQFDDITINDVIHILKNHITGFEVNLDVLTSISGTFVVDRLLIDPFLFRQMLIANHDLGQKEMFSPFRFVWPNEKGRGLSMRKFFILNFKLGDIQAKVTISRKVAKANDIFFIGDAPVRFKSGAVYNLVKISEVKSEEDALLVRDIIAALFYLYGRVDHILMQKMGLSETNIITQSSFWAQTLNYMLFSKSPKVNQEDLFQGAIFQQSLIMSAEDLNSIIRLNARLKAIDPVFWGKIATGKIISTGKQPIPIVSITDSKVQENGFQEWQNKVYQYFLMTQQDTVGFQRQIIRYPFEVVDADGNQSPDQPITNISPYFLVCDYNVPFFQLKTNDNPIGGRRTIHPFLISCSSKKHIETPGATPQEKLQHLLDLTQPFRIQLQQKIKLDNRSSYILTTFKILKPTQRGRVPASVVRVLSKSFDTISELSFLREGHIREPESLLEILIMSGNREDIRNIYVGLSEQDKAKFLKTVMKQLIDEHTNWNLGKQEFFDMDPKQIRELFMSNDVFIDPKLFKSVLEKFFGVFLFVIRFDDTNSFIEVPRHKYMYVNSDMYPKGTIPLVIFKHDGMTTSKLYEQCEEIKIFSNEIEINWEIKPLKDLFNKTNNTVDVNFVDVHLFNEDPEKELDIVANGVIPKVEVKPDLDQLFNRNDIVSQFIDGAGKLRSFKHRFEGNVLTIMCEPMKPLDFPIMEEDVSPQDYEESTLFIKSKGISDENIGYRLEKGRTKGNIIEGMWFSLQGVRFFIYVEKTKLEKRIFSIDNTVFFEPKPKEAMFWRHDHFERVANIIVQLLRNLYLYSRTDDPSFFINRMTKIISDNKYNIIGARRRIPSTRRFVDDLKGYAELYPSFFYSAGSVPKLILDSEKTRNALQQHLEQVQKLKEDTFGSYGSKFMVKLADNQVRRVFYQPFVNNVRMDKESSWGVNDFILNNLERIGQIFNRPGYLEQFYIYPSDFTVRGPDQQIFMSTIDVLHYMSLLDMQKTPITISLPLPAGTHLIKNPQYLILEDKPDERGTIKTSLYILQNVEGGSRRKVWRLIMGWIQEKINLGYFVGEYTGAKPDNIPETAADSLSEFDTIYNIAEIRYEEDKYAALLKLDNDAAYDDVFGE